MGFKVLWDFSVQCNRMVEARRPDIIFVDKQAREGEDHRHRYPWRCTSKRQRAGENREVPTSSRRNRKDVEAVESDGCTNCDRTLGAVSDMFEKYMGKLDVTIRLKVIEKTALLGTAGLDWTSCGPTYIQSFFYHIWAVYQCVEL